VVCAQQASAHAGLALLKHSVQLRVLRALRASLRSSTVNIYVSVSVSKYGGVCNTCTAEVWVTVRWW
jgi:hypothetical protein